MGRVEYWNGNVWLNAPSMTRLEGEVNDDLKENVEELIHMGVSRNSCKFCTSLGRILCHCPLSQRGSPAYYSVGVDPSRDFLLGCTSPKTVIQWSRNMSKNFFHSNLYGYHKSLLPDIELDEVVDHMLLKGEYVFEASL